MKKNKKDFFKLPALCCSISLFLVLLVTLIVTIIMPYSKGIYTYEDTVLNTTVKVEYKLKSKQKGVIAVTTTDADGNVNHNDTNIHYKVIDGKFLYSLTGENGVFINAGHINAFEIIVNESGSVHVMTNYGAVTAKVMTIVLLVASGLCALGSGIYIRVTKTVKHTKKKK